MPARPSARLATVPLFCTLISGCIQVLLANRENKQCKEVVIKQQNTLILNNGGEESPLLICGNLQLHVEGS